MPICTWCDQEKPPDKFSGDSRKKSGLSSHCKDCNNEKNRRKRKLNPQKARKDERRRGLLTRYGIDEEVYASMMKQQNYGCAICKRPESDRRWKNLAVDHDHKHGFVRGLLCSSCNLAIGNLQESPDLVKVALDYLLNPPFKIGRYEEVDRNRTCPCGRVFTREKLGNQVYCTLECRTQFYDEKRQLRYADWTSDRIRTCKGCQIVFESKWVDQVYCTHRCREATRVRRRDGLVAASV